MNQIINFTAFGILTLMWLAFAAALLIHPEILHKGWATFRKLHHLLQLALAFLFLPVVAGLWIWNTSWPKWMRLVLVIGLAMGTLYTFFPQLPLAVAG